MAADITDEQVASFFVNPVLLAMVRHVLAVPKGEWLLQSAAGSVLGRMIIKLGRNDGFKTIGVVRRHEAIADLKALGADAMISSSDGPIDAQVRAIVGTEGVKYALDPVGGDTGTGVFQSLAPEARMIVYGTLSQEPIRIDPQLMIAGKRMLEGFWLGHWMKQRSIPAALRLFHEIANLIRADVLATELGKTYPLKAFADAVRRGNRRPARENPPRNEQGIMLTLTREKEFLQCSPFHQTAQLRNDRSRSRFRSDHETKGR